MIDEQLLRREATAIRQAFEQCQLDGDQRYINTFFPDGCCGVAASILGHHFLTLGLPQVRRVSGLRDDNQSHAWVEVENWIVDITADQFEDVSDRVIVTSDRTWHYQFHKLQEYDQAGFAGYNDEASHAYIYQSLLATSAFAALPTRCQEP